MFNDDMYYLIHKYTLVAGIFSKLSFSIKAFWMKISALCWNFLFQPVPYLCTTPGCDGISRQPDVISNPGICCSNTHIFLFSHSIFLFFYIFSMFFGKHHIAAHVFIRPFYFFLFFCFLLQQTHHQWIWGNVAMSNKDMNLIKGQK